MQDINMKQKNKRLIVISALAIVIAVTCIICYFIFKEDEAYKLDVELYETESIPLGSGLVITDIGKYTGIFVEDGSDEPVSGIMMIILKNISGKDLQYGEIYVEYPSHTAEFTVSNLPNNGSVVLLEKNKKKPTQKELLSARYENCVFFASAMDTMEETFEISGNNGAMNVKNISQTDIDSPIEVYYKNSSTSLFYGGITYKITIPTGVKAGKMAQLYSPHYDLSNCKVVDIVIKEN